MLRRRRGLKTRWVISASAPSKILFLMMFISLCSFPRSPVSASPSNKAHYVALRSAARSFRHLCRSLGAQHQASAADVGPPLAANSDLLSLCRNIMELHYGPQNTAATCMHTCSALFLCQWAHASTCVCVQRSTNHQTRL